MCETYEPLYVCLVSTRYSGGHSTRGQVLSLPLPMCCPYELCICENLLEHVLDFSNYSYQNDFGCNYSGKTPWLKSLITLPAFHPFSCCLPKYSLNVLLDFRLKEITDHPHWDRTDLYLIHVRGRVPPTTPHQLPSPLSLGLHHATVTIRYGGEIGEIEFQTSQVELQSYVKLKRKQSGCQLEKQLCPK